MQYEKITLKNGLRIVLAPMAEAETVTVLVMTGVGSRYESRKENGIAHFLEHMMFKGTAKRPTARDISAELDGIGAEYNAFTGKECTGYYAKVAAPHAAVALDVVSDIFMNAKLEQEEITRESGTIVQELSMYEDMPMRHINDLFESHIYGDHPLGWEIIGTRENIRAFKRADFVRYMKRGYVAENVVVGVAGKFDMKQMRKDIESRFAHIGHGVKPVCKKAADKQSAPGLFIQKKKTDQTHMLLGVRAFDMFHPDRYALSVLATLLGGGMSSRLFIEVRNRRGLAYSVHTSVEAYRDAGYIATQCGVEHGNLEKTIGVILDEYRKIATEPVTTTELTKAKEYIKGKMAMSFEGSDDVIEYLVGQEIARGEIVLPAEKMALIEAVTPEDILRVAKHIFVDKKLNLAIIGPHAGKAKLGKMLRIDPA
ncbi:MAG: insulinase family protein [Candidatus Moranbacteria bacterium]|nr:insulinase family protein [Candidatus Moranbacteria bacterium]